MSIVDNPLLIMQSLFKVGFELVLVIAERRRDSSLTAPMNFGMRVETSVA